MFSWHTEFTTDFIQFLDVFFIEFLRATEQFALIQQLCIEFNGFHLHVCSVQVCAPCKSSVVLKKNCIEVWKIFFKVVRNFHCGRCTVLSDRNTSKSDNCFWHDRLCKRDTSDSKRCCIDRMSMYYRSYVRSLLIYSHMHFDFRRWFESRVSLNYITLSIYFTDELWSHKSFGYACWCAKEFVVIQLYGNVSVVSCNHVTVVDTSSDVTDLFFDFKFVYHAYFPPKAIWFFAAARQLKFSPWTTTLVLLYF